MDIGKIGPQPEIRAVQAQAGLPAREAVDLEKARRACKDFESILLYHMLCSMRQAFDSGGDSDGDFGGDVFKSMIDEELSLALARAGGIGLSRLMERGLGISEAAAGTAGITGAARPAAAVGLGAPGRAMVPPVAREPEVGAPGVGAASDDVTREAAATSEPKPAKREPVRIDELGDTRNPGHGLGARGLRAYESTIKAASKVFGLSADLIKAVILHESGGNPYAVSSKGAKGLMQLTDGTARTLGVTNPFNPVQNIFGGARYLGSLLKMFGGDLKLALASYNAGSGAVKKYGGVPPYKETQEYVKKVIASYQRLSAETQGAGHVYKS